MKTAFPFLSHARECSRELHCSSRNSVQKSRIVHLPIYSISCTLYVKRLFSFCPKCYSEGIFGMLLVQTTQKPAEWSFASLLFPPFKTVRTINLPRMNDSAVRITIIIDCTVATSTCRLHAPVQWWWRMYFECKEVSNDWQRPSLAHF